VQYSMENIGGCGTARACIHCGVRYAIAEALSGRAISRLVHPMDLIRNDEPVPMDFLVTTAPVDDCSNRLALLIMEDVTELMKLRQQKRPARRTRASHPLRWKASITGSTR
jgi:hypothetical protein